MYLTRFLALSFVLTLPLFAFSQTATSTAVQPPSLLDQASSAHAEGDVMIQNYLKTFPTNSELQTQAVIDDITIKTDPEYPDPNQTVIATVSSNLTDLNRATVSWSINDVTLGIGIGKTTFSFQNGTLGKRMSVVANITTINGERVTKKLSLTPMGITMLWEADTYTPPFYRGKALLSAEARVRAIALPDVGGTAGTLLNAGNFVYQWEKDGTVLGNMSGYGKNSFSFRGPQPFGKTGVRVRVSSLDNTLKSARVVDVPLSQPLILFYENYPLLGVWYNRPLDTRLSLSKPELSISAEPYFFSNEGEAGSFIAYDWSLNKNSVENPGNTITLTNEQGGKGDSSLFLSIRNLKQTFQYANQSLTIHFTANDSAHTSF